MSTYSARVSESLIQSITLEPAASTWMEQATAFARQRQPAAEEFRKELDISARGIVVMSGHQAELWHVGILAKWIAMTGLAQHARKSQPESESIWLVVDQDENDPSEIRYPTHTGNRLGQAAWKLKSPTLLPVVPTGSRPPLIAANVPDWKSSPPPADDAVVQGLARIGQSLAGFFTTRSAAEQFGLLAAQLCRWYGLEGTKPTELLMATDVAKTTAFQSLIERMRDGPEKVARWYNAAVEAAADAELRPMVINKERDRYELPLWLLRDGEPRKRVYSDDLAKLPREQWTHLAPRAILMTGLLRGFACDLFIHGMGGGKYDVAAETWFRSWLGIELAPKVVATATVHLPLADGPIPSTADVNRAWWKLQRARHDPDTLEDHAAGAKKRQFVEQIRQARETGQPSEVLYRAMHSMLATYRVEHEAAFAHLTREAQETQRRAEDSWLATDRTWPFPLHSAETIKALRDRIWTEFLGA